MMRWTLLLVLVGSLIAACSGPPHQVAKSTIPSKHSSPPQTNTVAPYPAPYLDQIFVNHDRVFDGAITIEGTGHFASTDLDYTADSKVCIYVSDARCGNNVSSASFSIDAFTSKFGSSQRALTAINEGLHNYHRTTFHGLPALTFDEAYGVQLTTQYYHGFVFHYHGDTYIVDVLYIKGTTSPLLQRFFDSVELS